MLAVAQQANDSLVLQLFELLYFRVEPLAEPFGHR